MRLVDYRLHGLENRHGGIQELHLSTRDHHLAKLTITSSEHVINELTLLD